MLEQLFGSRTRTKLLYLFLEHPEEAFFVREITRSIKERINSVRRELDNLEKFGLLVSRIENQKKYHSLDKNFVLYGELKALIDKSKFLAERVIAAKVKKLEGVKYLVLTGQLAGSQDSPTDVLIVGKISREVLAKFIHDLERAYRLPVRYTYLTVKEFNLRQDLTDKFLYAVINGPKVELINRLS